MLSFEDNESENESDEVEIKSECSDEFVDDNPIELDEPSAVVDVRKRTAGKKE